VRKRERGREITGKAKKRSDSTCKRTVVGERERRWDPVNW
jgi:hypothetical protein